MAVNLVHGEIRKGLLSGEDTRHITDYLGSQEAAEWFFSSGITGVTPHKVRDAKCLHAHVADALMRGRKRNAIGRATLELLERRLGGEGGGGVEGNEVCCQQCDSTREETESSWRYTPQKNKQRLRTQKQRRKEQKRTKKAGGRTGEDMIMG
ncbi:unnamed protein product [Discosporangium mesarthrocarpum]